MSNNSTLNNNDLDFDFEDFSDLENGNNQSNNKGNKKVKKQKAPKATNKPKKPLNKWVLIGAAACVIIVTGVCVVLNMPKNADKELTYAIEKESIDGIINIDNAGMSTEVDIENPNGKLLSSGNTVKIPVKINTKLDGDTVYKDYSTYVSIKYNQIVLGYDEVKKHVNDYNSTASSKINLPDKEAFYNSETPSELMLIDLTFSVPSDFPSSDMEHKYVGINPSISIKIKGTEQEDKISTDNYVYALPEFKSMCDDITTLHVGEEYSLKYIAVFPKGVSKDLYTINITYTEGSNKYTLVLENLDISIDAIK